MSLESLSKPNLTRYVGLVDCNNFFVSCERIFNPQLCNKPVVVLSNQNGVIVARSQEAKKLGIPMGAPFFKWKDFCKKYNVLALSSNFRLYADMSSRVMKTIRTLCSNIEVYSVDEAFFFLETDEDPYLFCLSLQERILQWTGIGVSCGISLTKTLAKAATDAAKKETGVFVLKKEDIATFAVTLPIEEVWGIGYNSASTLKKEGIFTAFDLTERDDIFIKKKLSVTGLRLAMELRGIPCLEHQQEDVSKKSITMARSFSKPLSSLTDIEPILSSYVEEVTEELRLEGSVALFIQVWLVECTSYETTHAGACLSEGSNYTPRLVSKAKALLQKLYKDGRRYKKVGFMVSSLLPETAQTADLFGNNPKLNVKEAAISEVVDTINRGRREKRITFGSSLGIEKKKLSSSWWGPIHIINATA